MAPSATALQALVAPDAATVTLIAEAAAAHVRVPGEVLTDAALARRVRDDAVTIVIVHTLGPTLARALRERPPALLVVTGPADDPLPVPPDTLLLGPEARLFVAPAGDSVACATSPAELAALLTALHDLSREPAHLSREPAHRHLSREPAYPGRPADLSPTPASPGGPADLSQTPAYPGRPADLSQTPAYPGRPADLSQTPASPGGPADLPVGVRLAACPTPPWWPLWLADPRLADARALGFVAAASLHPGWARWARAAGDAHAIVPLGLTAARLDAARDPSLSAAVAAHALERFTGPLFPSPQLLALLHAPSPPVPKDSPDSSARWAQARRALPTVAAGMDPVGLGLAAPTAAFLAQAARLRRSQTTALLTTPREPAAIQLDAAAVARAEEVLRGAGQVLSEHESKVVLRGFGVEITRQAVASSASGAAQYADTIGYPVVLKAVSPDLRRKQELGAVVLGLTTSAAVRRAYATIVHNVETHAPTAHLDGVLVSEQAPDGLELHCGAIRLHTGEMALFGRALGSPSAHEPNFALAPLTPADARLLAHAVLAPVPALRRASDPGVPELADLLLRLDALVQHFDRDGAGRLISVELTPLRLIGPPRGYLTLDARIVQRAHLEGA